MHRIVVLALFVLFTGAWAQQDSAPQSMPSQTLKPNGSRPLYNSAGEYRCHLVDLMLSEPEPLKYTGVLHWLGDETSTDIMKILNNKVPSAISDQKKILDMIHRSFEKPQFILEPANRTPDAALKLLDSISAAATDAGVKTRVATERSFAWYSTTMPLHPAAMAVDPTKPPPHPPFVITPN